MKQRGFTLIELLGVIIILTLIVVLVFPNIINSVKGSYKKTDSLTIELVYEASNLFISNHKSNFAEVNGNKFVISLNDLVNEGYLVSPIKLSDSNTDITNDKCIQVSYNEGYEYELKDNGECYEFSAPELYDNTLIPVIYNGENWVIADLSKEWYNYENQEWANAVILNDGVSKNPGTKIYPDGDNINIKAMFVWIPRYSYTIKKDFGVQLEGGGELSAETPGAIDIKFTSVNNTEAGSASYDGNVPSNWLTHPAFQFGNKQLSGIWVGKFETTGEVENPTILPSTTPLTTKVDESGNTISLRIVDQFKSAKVFNNYVSADSHMIKNSEWGAIAYLSQSKYGKYGNSMYTGRKKEIYINFSGHPYDEESEEYTYDYAYDNDGNQYKKYHFDYSLLLTGSSNGTIPNGSNIYYPQCRYDDITDRGEGNGSCGGGASTTGNITGVYDTSGGAWEAVMGVFVNSEGELFSGIDSYNSGFNGYLIKSVNIDGNWVNQLNKYEKGESFPNPKYYETFLGDPIFDENGYLTNTNISRSTACNGLVCYGHAFTETESWYYDYNDFIATSSPWLVRGGGSNFNILNISRVGIFNTDGDFGQSKELDTSFRVTIVNGN